LYLTILAIFLVAIGAVTGGISSYSDGTLYIKDSTLFGLGVLFTIIDFMYEVGKFLFKLLVKPEEKQAPEKPKETSSE
jgi:hypothetical protein